MTAHEEKTRHVYLPVPCDFSVNAVNAMLDLARHCELGKVERIDYYGEWDWCLRCEHGLVWSYRFPEGYRAVGSVE